MTAQEKLRAVQAAATQLVAIWDDGDEETHEAMLDLLDSDLIGLYLDYDADKVVTAISVLAACLAEDN